jgi:hypothetical protein
MIHFGIRYRKTPPPNRTRERSTGIRRVAGLTRNRLLMGVNHKTGKCTSGMDKYGSAVDRMYMKLGGNFLNSLRVKTQLLKGSSV